MRTTILSIVTALCMVFSGGWDGFAGAEADAAPLAVAGASVGQKDRTANRSAKKTRKARRGKRGKKRAKKSKVCTRRKGKRRCRWVTQFSGQLASKDTLRSEPLDRPSGEIWLYAVNFREELKVNIYDADGDFNDEALAQLDNIFRCKRSRQVRAVRPELYEMLSVIYDHYGKRRIDLISGFRKKPDKETSRHFHGSAMDIRVPGVSVRELFQYASSLDAGGMGVGKYPRSDFVHIDFRAPGEKSYRWTDYSPPSSGKKKRKPRKSRRASRPNS